MCDPVSITLASTALNAGSAVLGYVGQRRTANATTEAANAALDADYASLGLRAQQESQANSDRMTARAREGSQRLGQVQVALADAGFSGNTADRLRAEPLAGIAEDLTTGQRQGSMITNQLGQEAAGARARAQSTINSAPRPSLLGTGLQIAGAAVGGYERHQALSRPRGG